MERVGNENHVATFHPNTLEELIEDKELMKKNKLSVTFVENILGMFNWLAKNPNPDRFLLALYLFSFILITTLIHFCPG